MGIGDQTPPDVELVDWYNLYNRITNDEPVIDGLAYRGRWTAIVAPAKAGKSTVLLALAAEVARSGLSVLYLDAEMGRGDVLDRVEDWMGLKPADLERLHYTDLPPKIDDAQGATALWNVVKRVNPDLVIIDGLNGVVNGAENDDTTWRDMYELAIAPLKATNVAILSADNMGKNRTLGPRGSSVKLDKADAVLEMERTTRGQRLTATHRRSASYPQVQEYTVDNADENDPPMSVKRVGVGTGAPDGTEQIVAILDQLGAPLSIGRRPARRLLKDNGHEAPGDKVLPVMLRWRRDHATLTLSGASTTLHHPAPPPQGGAGFQHHPDKTPGQQVVLDGASLDAPPSAPGAGNTAPVVPAKRIPTAEEVGL